MTKQNDAPVMISDVIGKYIEVVKLSRSEHTARAYKNALKAFCDVLTEKWLDPRSTPIEKLTEDIISPFAMYLKVFAPATEFLYMQAVKGFYEYVDSERYVEVNISRVRTLIRQRSRRPGIRLPQFPAEDIERILAHVSEPSHINLSTEDRDGANEQLRAMRDRAFLLMLADTGLRVHEACKLRRGDVDWNEGRAVIIGKGDKQAVVRFSTRSMKAIKDYLSLRAQLDGGSGKQLASLPLFSRHDKGAGKKVKPITPTTGRNIVAERVLEILGKDAAGKITPHSFRHYFVTTVLRGSGNLKLAQELARHSNIQVTQRYAHLSDDELDKGYYEIFEDGKNKTTL
ncbi:tyrosine-type recombinase/integrase [Candidatus Villigracilis saccharophilus]|uniref:tyrosine-type recombinase/integrase n=1 Tax=Candidatus Villigracilis saccharophilus TaxID=3140684 RepID=UPI0031375AA1|nr:tyrosine-type recombinase/integrase [Anaerolineales bacterium]